MNLKRSSTLESSGLRGISFRRREGRCFDGRPLDEAMDTELRLPMEYESRSRCREECGAADDNIDEPADIYVFSVRPREWADGWYLPGV